VPQQARGDAPNITVLLRISMPVFLAASAPSEAHSTRDKASALIWRAWAESPSRVVLAIENGGTSHVKFNSIALAPAETKPEAAKEAGRYAGLLYVLPGATRRIAIPVSSPFRPGERLSLTAASEGNSIVANAVIGSKPDAQDPG
jgi:P pilus assembly chaperone PapD